MNGYFQLGGHGSEEAYANVRRFFDTWVVERPAVPKMPGTDLSLMNCIDAYESVEYGRVVQRGANAAASGLRIRTPSPCAATVSARPTSPLTRTASWGQAA